MRPKTRRWNCISRAIPIQQVTGRIGKLVEADGKTLKKDSKNPDERLRNRTLLNTEFIAGLFFRDGAYKNGKLYAAQIGKSVNCTMRFNGEKVSMRIYVGFPFWE